MKRVSETIKTKYTQHKIFTAKNARSLTQFPLALKNLYKQHNNWIQEPLHRRAQESHFAIVNE